MESAWTAVEFARLVRKTHRRRSERGAPQREADIQEALGRLKSSMRPLRRLIGAFPYGPQTEIAEHNRLEIRHVSKAIQAERRKLWKMRKREEA